MAATKYSILLIQGFIHELETNNKLSPTIPNDVIHTIIQFHHIPIVCILDTGSGTIKTGFPHDYFPRSLIPNVCGRLRPQLTNTMLELSLQSSYSGDEAINKRGILNLTYPMQHGVVCNWDDMEQVWREAFSQHLKTNAANNYVLLTESAINPQSHREKIVEIMFEKFNVDGLCIAIDAVLSLYASGWTTGVVLQSGYGGTYTVPIYEGYCLRHAVKRTNIGGSHITDYMLMLLEQRGYTFYNIYSHKCIVKDIKEKVCYVALDYELEVEKAERFQPEYEYILPDGEIISIDTERFESPEILFKPSLIGCDDKGIARHLFDSIMECHVDIRTDLSTTVLLSGGNTMFKGFGDRIKREMMYLMPSSFISMGIEAIDLIEPSDRKYSSWIGATILSQVKSYMDKWIKRWEYDQYGPSIVHRKCL